MTKSYSIAEARNRFTSIIREVEHSSGVEITRHGEPVAVLLSYSQYRRLSETPDFSDAYRAFRETFNLADLGIEPENFADLRDRSPGREDSL